MQGNSYFVGGAAAAAVGIALFSALIEPISNALGDDLDFTLLTILYSAPVTAFLLFSKRIGPVGALVQTASTTLAHFLAVRAALEIYDPDISLSGASGGDSASTWPAGAAGGAIGSVLSFAAMAALSSSLRTRPQMARYAIFAAILTALGSLGVWLYQGGPDVPMQLAIFIPWQAVFSVALILAFREAKTP